MKIIRVHYCQGQEMVAQRLAEPPAKKCSCRKLISREEANELVKNGAAKWCVTKRERGTHEAICSLCKGSKEVKNCAKCRGTGKTLEAAVWDTYNHDIVLVSRESVDEKEKKYRPAIAQKTPRVATIEEEHIVRAYVDGGPEAKDAAERIEDYGYMSQIVLQEQGAALVHKPTGFVLVEGKPEPKDDRSKGEGRAYDYGRKI